MNYNNCLFDTRYRCNRKLAAITILLFAAAANGAQPDTSQIDPEATEIWEPVPQAVTPGTRGSPPSDAIVLFAGNDLSLRAISAKTAETRRANPVECR